MALIMGLSEAVASGDRAEALEALRDLLAARIEGSEDDRVIAPLAKQLADVMRELEQIGPRKTTVVDELERKRAERLAKVQKRAAGRDKRGARGD